MPQREEMLEVKHFRAKIQFLIYGQLGPQTKRGSQSKKVQNLVKLHLERDPHFEEDERLGREFVYGNQVSPVEVVSPKMLFLLIGVTDQTGGEWTQAIPRTAAEKIACLFQFECEWKEWQSGSVRDFVGRYDLEHRDRRPRPGGKLIAGPKTVEVWPGSLALGEARLFFESGDAGGVRIGALVRGHNVVAEKRNEAIQFSMAYLDVLLTPRNDALTVRDVFPVVKDPNVHVRRLHKAENGRTKALVCEFDAASKPIIECSVQAIALFEGLVATDTAIGILIVPARKLLFGYGQFDSASDDRKVVQLNSRTVTELKAAAEFARIPELRDLPSIWKTKAKLLVERSTILEKFEQSSEVASESRLGGRGLEQHRDPEKEKIRKKNRDGYYVVSWHALRFEEASQ